ncbi:MAG: hypothetical protein Q8N88_00045, partial [Nanoarchaeota archaeon]|nr:hypothetical protein [Nanoarchaeota archaeon]
APTGPVAIGLCAGCLLSSGLTSLEMCSGLPVVGQGACYFYPCQADCNDQDGYYSSPWDYYCDGNTRRKSRQYYDFDCTSDQPREGWCNFSNRSVDDQAVETCPNGCENGRCLGPVTCYSDLGCGVDSWIGSPYCSGGDVWQYYREPDCHYPGTENSYCTYPQSPKKKQDCTSGTCDNGQCVGNVYCEAQDPDKPYYCNGYCVGCSDNNLYSPCCPDSGIPQHCCDRANGPCCDTSTGNCTICCGNYPISCNNKCWVENICPSGYGLCCPSSGDPQYCCNSTISVCLSNGSCAGPTQETCNGIDDNYDGYVDNNLGSGNYTLTQGCGVGLCAGGTQTCIAASNWSECSTSGNAVSETCNNVDDNCDGTIDENLSQECGTDVGACVKGTQLCSSGNWGTCGGSYIGPTNETCNGIDDNCNNITDEDNVCGNYPNVTLIFPTDNYVDDTGNLTFNCSVTDDSKLANITLWHNLNGSDYLHPNETEIITGVSNSTTWIINNIGIGNYIWNCLAYDNDSHWSWSENGPFSFTVTEPGLIRALLLTQTEPQSK